RGNVTVIASHPVAGSSVPVELAETQDSTQHVQLVVLAQGSIAGTVTAHGAPAPNTMVTAQSTTAPTVLQMVRTGTDGRYSFDRVAADTYAVSVGLGAPMTGMLFIGRTVPVKAGEAVTAELVPGTGPGSVAVTPTLASGGSKIIMVFTSRGEITATNASEVLHAVTHQGEILWAWNVTRSGTASVISGLPAGHYTSCAVPFAVTSGALPDLASLMRETDLPARCQGYEVGSGQAVVAIAIAAT
ncbi:MAG: carboxypeptidase-like regulatory domain-containing protein, partial [Kofleriaceae bacterium]